MTFHLRKAAVVLFALLLLSAPEVPAYARSAGELPRPQTSSDIQIKDSLPPALRKLSTDLVSLLAPGTLPQGSSSAGLRRAMEANNRLSQGKTASGESVPLAYVYIRLSSGASLDDVSPYLAELCNADVNTGLLAAKVALPQLEALAARPQVVSIETVSPPVAYAGDHMTEGDALLGADQLRAQGGVDGAGVKIGVISDGLDGINTAKGYGDLPATLKVLNDRNSGAEGTAMLEIIHDIAPGAELYFHDCGTNMLQFNQAIDALVTAGCTIICDDIGWQDAPVFEDGVIAKHIAELAAKDNVLFVSAAGNAGQTHYQGLFYDPDGDKRSDFSEGTNAAHPDLYVRIPKNGTLTVMLQWDEKITTSSKNPISDYDLYVYNVATGSLIAQSSRLQSETGEPIEVVHTPVNSTGPEYIAGIYVKAYKAPTPRTIEVYAFPTRGSEVYLKYGDNSTPEDSIFGHPTVPSVLTCGAVGAASPDQVEPYSSRGAVTMLAETRQKPDLCGVAGVTVSGAGGFGSPFYGTSAAAPHVAGIAALLKQQTPAATASELKQKLTQSAVDLGAPGYDPVYGYGRVNAFTAPEGQYVVTFNSMGGSPVRGVIVAENGALSKPADPTRSGYIFDGWYREQACVTPWNFDTDVVTDNMTLFAKWLSPKPPAVPASVKAVVQDYQTIRVSYAPVADATGYEIYRAAKAAGPYTLVKSLSGATFSDGGRAIGTAYYYKVRAYRMFGSRKLTSGYSAVVSAKTALTAPSPAKAVSAGYNSVRLTWAVVPGATGYEVYRAASAAGAYAKVYTAPAGSVFAYTNGALKTGTTYYYKVRALRKTGSGTIYSAYTAVTSAKPMLAAPTGLAGRSASYCTTALSWQSSPGATGYQVYRAASQTGVWQLVATTGSRSVVDIGLATDHTYYYKVRAYRKVGAGTIYSDYSAVTAATPVLSVPAHVQAAAAGSGAVAVTWDKVIGATGYELYVSAEEEGEYTLVSAVPATADPTLAFTHTGLTPGVACYYKVRACRVVGTITHTSAYCVPVVIVPE